MQGVRLVVTGDGSHSLVIDRLNESYHSLGGAFGESRHVFIREGLLVCLKKHGGGQSQSQSPLRILEVGLGTGLNALLTLEQAILYDWPISYTGLEPHPLPQFLAAELNYPKFLDARVSDDFMRLHALPWEEAHLLHKNLFTLVKHKIRLEDFEIREHYDLIYFDAFAASKQKEIWSEENFKKLYNGLRVGGVLVSYAANRNFKDQLTRSGFTVISRPGAMGKREMVRGERREN